MTNCSPRWRTGGFVRQPFAYAGIPALCGCRVDRQGTLAPACPILPPLGPQMPRKHRGRHAQPMGANIKGKPGQRSEEHTSELQSLLRISYAVLCLKKKNQTQIKNP